MMQHTTVYALGQDRLAEMHHQAQRDALARAARRAHRTRQQRSTHPAPRLLAVVTRWAHRPRPARGVCDGARQTS